MLQHAEHSFHGGIHPAENKTQSLQLPLGKPPLPEQLILPLGQHIGQASRPLVSVGDKVLKGQPIAISNGFLSSYLHAPTSGEITEINEHAIPHPSGLKENCIILTPDNQETWAQRSPCLDWQTQAIDTVIEHLSSMGIVGMGGAGFPTQVKLSGGYKHLINELIINAAECEPYITADDMLMREKSEELIKGIQVLQHLMQAEKVLIGIEDNKPTAIQILQTAIKKHNAEIQLVVVPTKYPSGGEKQLIQLLTGKEVPSGKLPSDVGVVCQNVGTCVAVYDAIYQGQPLISRITTLTGDAIEHAQNIDVLLGTPISHLMQYANLDTSRLERLVVGGPMMGFTITDTNIPIIKTTNCILAATNKELPKPEPEQACIRCGMCEQACPASLLPQQLLWFSKSQEHDKAEHYNLFDCIECGACSYVCPSSIPLVQYYRHSKSTIREARESTIKADHAKLRFEARQARIEAEAAEKEAKRQANRAKANVSAAKPAANNPTTQTASQITTATETQSAEQVALKKLKVELAIANTKLKKAQKSLITAQESADTENISLLQTQVNELDKTVQEIQQQIEQKAAELPNSAKTSQTINSQPVSQPAKVPVSDELKKAKVALAIASTTLKKVQKQLAEEPDNLELQTKEKVQQEAVQKAEATWQELSKKEPPKESQTDNTETAAKSVMSGALKKAKVDMAIAATHLKKVQEKLSADPNNDELQLKLKTRQEKFDSAQLELARLQQEPLVHAQQTTSQTIAAKNEPVAEAATSEQKEQKRPPINDAVKKAKIDLAIAKAASKKLEKAVQKAEALQLPELDALQTQYQAGMKRIEQLEAELSDIVQGKTSNVNEPQKALVADPKKQLKIDHALAKAALNKANRAIEVRQKEGAGEAELENEGLLAKLREQEAVLANVESKLGEGELTFQEEREQQKQRGNLTQPVPVAKPKENMPPELPSFEHLTEEERLAEVKKQKIAAAMEKAKILKLQRQLESESDPAAKKIIHNKIEEARQKKNIAEHTLSKLHDVAKAT